MMNQGGIFSGPNALGTVEMGVFFRSNSSLAGLGAVSQACTFYSSYPIGGGEAARAIQTEMVRRGATGLKVDGYWGNCSESAYQKLFGSPLSKASIEKNFPITCSSFSKAGSFSPSNCKNGTDAITAVAPSTPPVVTEVVPGTNEPLPVLCGEGYVHDPLTGGCKRIPGVPAPAPPAPAPPVVRPPAAAAIEKTWIPGLPNTYAIAIGVGVVGITAILLLKAKS